MENTIAFFLIILIVSQEFLNNLCYITECNVGVCCGGCVELCRKTASETPAFAAAYMSVI